ncbi:phospholipase A [Pseudoalteromonas peptidolytica]|uniref:phospholipase A n=1 Tax=Pseudoalteromonas peptidolytica TaxID=61150 RepID=UPI00298DBA86|nr:phospholipase A [Pseudoalteromonas peptidolytica]MDW7550404.1 phospholipase A [Pseudoalteromonas peptidolytica]
MNITKQVILTSLLVASESGLAGDASKENDCILNLYNSGSGELTLSEMRMMCGSEKPQTMAAEKSEARNTGRITNRRQRESQTEFEPYVITPHNMNYILPAYSTSAINREAYRLFDGYGENLEDIETKFQLSLKVPLNYGDMLLKGDALYLGFTLEAWWQVYSSNISKPFRETNYTPEIFYYAPLNWQIFGGNTAVIVGLEHQSNGRSQLLSRSWNRAYTGFLFEKDNFVLSFRSWYRLEEDEKEFEFDPGGDDNPDIEDYMGHYELGIVYKWDMFEFSFMGRRNFSTDFGAVEAGMTFPLWGKLRGYATAFHGYGESLIDYNHKQSRFGIGIALNDIL